MPARIDWWLAAACVAAGLLLSATGAIPAPDAAAMLGSALRNPYYTGPVLVLLFVWGESALRPLPRSRPLRTAWLAVAALATAHLFHALPAAAADQWIARLYLAAALGAGVAALALAAYLPAAGLVPFRRLLAVTGRWAGVFAPFLVFILAAGFGTALVARLRPVVEDPRLLRMDESLGFHAAMFFGSFDYVGSWLWDVQYVFYAGIGMLVMAVAGRLYLRDDRPALRHFLLAVILAGLLGWVGYWLLPGVGPVTAFPELFTGSASERQAALAAALAEQRPMIQPPQFPRDCAPSLHTAWALIALLAAWRQGWRFFLPILPLGAMSIVTTLTLCKHYTADLVLAAPFALLCWRLAALLAQGLRAPSTPSDSGIRGRIDIFLLAEAGALGAFWWWASQAPIPPWLAWPLVAACVALPPWAARHLNQRWQGQAGAASGRPPSIPRDGRRGSDPT